MKGQVLRSTGSFYDILAEDGNTYVCKVRGKIRLEGIKETNPVAVGDRVVFENSRDVGAITEILPRDNHILRQSIKKSAHAHVLAANVDQVMLVATIALPRTSFGFIDRFLVSAESFRIPQIIIFNKQDLLDEDSLAIQKEAIAIYENIGVTCMAITATQDDVPDLKEVLRGKTTLIAGHSGVGKSTLLNKLAPHVNQKVGEISEFSSKGMHTTTFAEMFLLEDKTFVVDTPGIKEWGLIDMEEQEISDYFPEMRELRLDCKFGSKCLHINEPKCAVIKAVEEGKIAISRYESYYSIVLGEDNRK
ncbi:ribosome small subunit-dependent GTPase A [Chryseosolibacter indicus]|uniref:Small ribosomal subunit biogenesis GTPase RsgA n=1 Tax=Chryseosolibacter indicus TaxID=2782351 RepID=A0ABS5VPK2_9BACT|nr:ribosome small subunit-dependent GTPase A [Chryseosolibacter indicus]MBT1702770.1 ribosome small subunit-dependent GTPase A [Chryseosolibacter indicus]